jgi:hypothetical protein
MLKTTFPLVTPRPAVNPKLEACLNGLYRHRAILDSLIAALEAYRDDTAGCPTAQPVGHQGRPVAH